MNASTVRASVIDAARPIIREQWPLGWSTERIGSWCGLTANVVMRLAREMELPERGQSRKKMVTRVAGQGGQRRGVERK